MMARVETEREAIRRQSEMTSGIDIFSSQLQRTAPGAIVLATVAMHPRRNTGKQLDLTPLSLRIP